MPAGAPELLPHQSTSEMAEELLAGPSRIAAGAYGCAIRSPNQESAQQSAVAAIAVGWPVKPWGTSG
ncbi:hypothetical protein GCM10027570_41750 [Streptomonospora sediminis]